MGNINTIPPSKFPPSSEDVENSGGGEQYVLPIASAETLGGVKVGNGLSVNAETGELSNSNPTPYTLPIAGAETLGGVKVGTGLSIDAETGELSNTNPTPYTPPAYSTTETATGKKWIDGKDIYASVIPLSNVSVSGGNDTVIMAFANKNLIFAIGNIIEDSVVYVVPDISMRVKVINNNLCLFTPQGSSWAVSSGNIIVFYTKTESEE